MATLRQKEEAQGLQASLTEFTRGAWPQLERKAYIHNWHIDAIAEHLEAVTRREIKRLIINVPFRTMKSTLVNVAWPAWIWSFDPGHQFLCGSHAEKLAARDNLKHRRLVSSPWYRARWGSVFALTGDQNQKMRFENNQNGYRIGFGMTSGITGDGGDTVVIDDPHDRDKAQSDAERERTLETFDQSVITRLNDPEHSAVVVIMQRLHEDDLSGHILAQGGWEHLMLPMEYDPGRHCVTSIGFSDPRGCDEHGEELDAAGKDRHEGELLWEERFPRHVVDSLTASLGPYGASGQLQQSPTPVGGGIFKRDWWQLFESADGKFPVFEYLIASLDSAFTEKEQNDPSALTVWGVFVNKENQRRIMLVHAWRKHLQFSGPRIDVLPGESKQAYIRRTQETWGLIEWVQHTCERFKVDKLLIEAKASGISAGQELRNRYGLTEFAVQLCPVSGDKVARALAAQPTFSQLLVYAPDRDWAEQVIEEMAVFPKGKYKDLTDSATQAVKYLRDTGMAQTDQEASVAETERVTHRPRPKPIYPV